MKDAAEQSRACDIPGVAHTAHPALLVTPPLRLVHIPSKRVWTSMREGPGSSGLAEAVTLIKGLLNGEQVALAGRHYRVTGRTNYPLPVQRPPPPIPHRRQGRSLLSLAAREADIVGYSGITFLPRWRGTGHFNRLENGDVSLPCRVGSSNDPLTIPRLQRKAMRSLSTDLL